MNKILAAFTAAVALIFSMIVPVPVFADYQLLSITGNPLTQTGTAPYLVLSNLSGQSACAVTLAGTPGGSYAVEGFYKGAASWTPALTVVSPDGTTSSTSITAAGSYAFNCASMIAVRLDGSAGSGSPLGTLTAGGGINRVLGAGINGGKTNVVGAGPVTVTNAGNTATVGLLSPLPIAYGGTNNTTFTTGQCLFYNGSQIAGQVCSTPGPAATPVSVQAGSNVTVATPSAGVFVVSAVTPPPASVTSSNSNIVVATPAANTFVLTAVTPSPPSITAGNTNVTVATPAANTYVISAATSAPASITSANTNLTVATPAANTFVLTAVTPAPPTITAGTGITVATPAANSYVISATNTGAVTTVTGSGNIQVTAGPTPNVTITNAPTFTNQVTSTNTSPGFNFYAGNGTALNHPMAFSATNATGNNADIGPDNTRTVNGVTGDCETIANYSGLTFNNSIATFSCSGSEGVNGQLAANSLLASGLTSGQCVTTTTGGLLTTTGASCATGGGLTGIVAGNDIVVSPATGPTPTVAVTNSPTFTGTTTTQTLTATGTAVNSINTAGGITAATSLNAANAVFSSTSNNSVQTAGGIQATAIASPGPGCLFTNSSGVFSAQLYCLATTTAAFTAPAVGTQVNVTFNNTNMGQFQYSPVTIINPTNTDVIAGYFYGGVVSAGVEGFIPTAYLMGSPGDNIATGSEVWPGNIPFVKTGSNIVVTNNTAGPTVAVTAAPTFTGPVTANSFKNSSGTSGCVIATLGVLTTASYGACQNFISVGVTIAQIGSTMTINTSYPNSYNAYTPITISDGTNSVSGYVNANVTNANSFVLYVTGINQGAVGNTLAANNPIYTGGAFNMPTYIGGTPYAVGHIEVGSVSTTANTTTNVTFAKTFNAAPYCNISQIGSNSATYLASPPTTTTLAVLNTNLTNAITVQYECTGK